MINIVLFEPEIPQNTGNIMRTCVATGAKLHLIEPLGFKLDESNIKRSGVNYIENCNYTVYKNFAEFKEKNEGIYFFSTRYGTKPPSEMNFKTDKDIYIIFGKESTGIPKELMKNQLDYCMRLPMTDKTRALNLSNCVAIITYEVLRQNDYFNLLRYEPFKGNDYLERD